MKVNVRIAEDFEVFAETIQDTVAAATKAVKAAPLPSYLRPDEVCKSLDISKRKLKELRDGDMLPCSKVGRKYYYHLNAITHLMDKNNIMGFYLR